MRYAALIMFLLFLIAILLFGCSDKVYQSGQYRPEPIGPYYIGDIRAYEPFIEPCRHVFVNIASDDVNDSIRIKLTNHLLTTDEFDLILSVPDKPCICIKCHKQSKCHGE